jgi:hypothetical protein
MRARRQILFASIALILGSCRSREPDQGSDSLRVTGGVSTQLLALSDSVEIVLEVPDTVVARHPLEMRIALRNRLKRTVSILMTPPPVFANFVVRDNSGRIQWQLLSDSGGIAARAIRVRLAPDSATTFSRSWNQSRSDGSLVEPGVYSVAATLLLAGGNVPLGPVKLVIMP